ncbi:MAG: hypothetical protein ACKVX7_06965 [Planctomycetota bacterium]
MDRAKFRSKVFQRHLLSPFTLAPLVTGLSLLTVAWGAGDATWLLAGGVAGVLASVGAFVTSALLRTETFARRVYEEMQSADFAAREAALNALDARLAKDRDPRDEQSLRTLRTLFAEFQKDAQLDKRVGANVAAEISGNVDRLYRESLSSLERCLELADAAGTVRAAETRRTLLEAREQVLGEIEANVAQLANTLDGLRTLKLRRHDDEDLARVRAELAESLNVATRVEDRIHELERDLSRDDRKRE